MPENQVVSIHATIWPWQRAEIEAYAKDEGKLGLSEALRDILSEWRNFKAIAAGIPLTALPQDETP